LASKYTDEHRPLQEVREQIRITEEALSGENSTHTEETVGIDVNNPYQKIEFELDTERALLDAQSARYDFLTKEIGGRKEKLEAMAEHEIELSRLERNIRVLESEYTEYRNNLRRAHISSQLDKDQVSNVSVVQPATRPMDPVKPNKKLNIALGILFGLFGALGFAFFLEFLDDTLKTNEAVERHLGLPVLAAISYEDFKSCT